MADELYAVAGLKFFIGGELAPDKEDMEATDFSSIVWKEVDGWETMGAIGDNYALITASLINRGRDVKMKGTANAGQMQNQFAVLAGDAGQLAIIAASKTRKNYAFKIEFNDTPSTGSAPTPSMKYFVGMVMSAQEQGGNANTARMLSSTIEINSNIVDVAAAAGP